jgi:hypothetical protein
MQATRQFGLLVSRAPSCLRTGRHAPYVSPIPERVRVMGCVVCLPLYAPGVRVGVGVTKAQAASCRANDLGHEHVEIGGGVLAERTAPCEAIAPIERMRGLEGPARARLEKQA